MSPAEARLKDVSTTMTEAEWTQRVNLAAAYRLIAYYGWDDLVDTHISARVPGPEQHFLINPYGLMFDEITASSLVKVDLDGNQLTESEYSINPAGFTIHSAIHEGDLQIMRAVAEVPRTEICRVKGRHVAGGRQHHIRQSHVVHRKAHGAGGGR